MITRKHHSIMPLLWLFFLFIIGQHATRAAVINSTGEVTWNMRLRTLNHGEPTSSINAPLYRSPQIGVHDVTLFAPDLTRIRGQSAVNQSVTTNSYSINVPYHTIGFADFGEMITSDLLPTASFQLNILNDYRIDSPLADHGIFLSTPVWANLPPGYRLTVYAGLTWQDTSTPAETSSVTLETNWSFTNTSGGFRFASGFLNAEGKFGPVESDFRLSGQILVELYKLPFAQFPIGNGLNMLAPRNLNQDNIQANFPAPFGNANQIADLLNADEAAFAFGVQSQAAVPEPSSLACISITTLMTFSMRFRRKDNR